MSSPDTMESRIAEIERLMQDKTLSHSDQQLLDQELDELLRAMDAADEFRAMNDFLEPECWNCGEHDHRSAHCPAPPPPRCIDCGADGAIHVSLRGNMCNECMCEYIERELVFPEDEEEDDRGCEHCSGCFNCSAGRYDLSDEV